MSRQLDYNNLSDDDKEWLRARGQGNRIPGEAKSDPQGVVLDANASGEEVLAKTPNTGTATRPADHGVAINPVNPEGYTAEDYTSWKVDELKAEISDRNETREDEAAHIRPESDKKAHLVAALVADDEAHESDEDEQE